MTKASADSNASRAATGISGLDEILGGGLPRNRIYLVEGGPGAGKTTLAMQFLREGARCGEPTMYVLLSETAEELRAVAASHHWSLDGVEVFDLQSSDENLRADSQYTLFHPADVEWSETSQTILETVERVKPRRAVFDSLSEVRLLSRDPLRYRRQILALKQCLTSIGCTVLMLDFESSPESDHQLQSLCHGVIRLEQLTPEYGGQRRRLAIQKLRGISYRDGYHDFTIQTGGIEAYPRLVAAEHHRDFANEQVRSGVPGLDQILGGGLDRGTSTLILGPAGVGKSTLAAQYVAAAVRQGEKSALYIFDEVPHTFAVRGAGLGMGIADHIRSGRIAIQQVNPAELSPGEFAMRVRNAVERDNRNLVVIDSLNGYNGAMPEERFLSAHLHELLAYLNQRGVITILIVSQLGLLGQGVESPIDLSYLADTVILLRYFEAFGEVRQAISVVKRRTGAHEHSIRELRMGPGGILVGERLQNFQGVLSGQLVYTGDRSPLLTPADGANGR
jgi:circadian clock protein KaiC